METRPTEVANKPKQAGEIRSRWEWTEPSVWTENMLTALERGVKGGKWFSLIDKVWDERNLRASFDKVKSNRGASGIDGKSIHEFEGRLDCELGKISEQIRNETYAPQAVRRVWIPKPGSSEKRPLGIPTVKDRMTQTALRNVIEPVFERIFSANSYGFRPGRGCKDALRMVDALLKGGFDWIVDADLKAYFDSIPHEKLMAEIEKEISDGRILALIRQYLKQKVMEGLEGWTPEEGTPQGAVISPLLANIYLNPLDHKMEEAGKEMIRYADDFVILCKTREEAEEALETVRQWTKEAGLALHPEKTRIVNATEECFEFLGYRFEKGRCYPRRKSLDKFRDKIREITRRNNGQSLDEIISRLNLSLTGWFGYFKHCRKCVFKDIDGWVRMRLRSILRKRQGRRGRAKGDDNHRWRNKFFVENGLFSLSSAHLKICQSRC
jgi:RNA-directed DNA polymerase